MVIDTSAICAIVFREPGAEDLARLVLETSDVQVSAATYVEATTVIGSRNIDRRQGKRDLDGLLRELGVTIVDFDTRQSAIAADGWLAYGRGSRQPSKLNLGDTFAYALARAQRAPLLYVGDDFVHTDVEPALP
ncbi:MAG: type II toxin-antitoxin system VapC family toxin [Caulobacteraceae bacterium]|nr:type II toxin-antitoxin system VapC family toxin [Caulobacteraceae bacterium]